MVSRWTCNAAVLEVFLFFKFLFLKPCEIQSGEKCACFQGAFSFGRVIMPDANPTRKGRRLTKEQIIKALRAAARKLGRAPNGLEFRQMSGITKFKVARRFQSYNAGLRAAGLTPSTSGTRIETAILFEDWGKVTRKIGGVPSQSEYLRDGKYSLDCLIKRVYGWARIPAEFARFVAAGGLAGDWNDVLEMIRQGPIPTWGGSKGLVKKRAAVRAAYAAQEKGLEAVREAAVAQKENMPQCAGLAELPQDEVNTVNPQILPPPLWGKKCVTDTMLAVFIAELAPSGLPWITAACFPRRPLKDRPLLGAPMPGAAIHLPAFPYEPVNEMGVMVLFSMLAQRLGFVIESVQSGFPDCQARIEVEPGRWQHFRIEFEYESLQFKKHGHDPGQCDLIVCWRHNWKNCPPNLQVLELSKIVAKLTKD